MQHPYGQNPKKRMEEKLGWLAGADGWRCVLITVPAIRVFPFTCTSGSFVRKFVHILLSAIVSGFSVTHTTNLIE